MTYTVYEYQVSTSKVLVIVNNAKFKPAVSGWLYKTTYDHGFSSDFHMKADAIITSDMITREFIIDNFIMIYYQHHELTGVYSVDLLGPVIMNYKQFQLASMIIHNNVQIQTFMDYYEQHELHNLLASIKKHVATGLDPDEWVRVSLNMYSCVQLYVSG